MEPPGRVELPLNLYERLINPLDHSGIYGAPDGTRTRVSTSKGLYDWPLHYGSVLACEKGFEPLKGINPADLAGPRSSRLCHSHIWCQERDSNPRLTKRRDLKSRVLSILTILTCIVILRGVLKGLHHCATVMGAYLAVFSTSLTQSRGVIPLKNPIRFLNTEGLLPLTN